MGTTTRRHLATDGNGAATRLLEESEKFAARLQLALEMEHRETVHRIRMEVQRKHNMGQHMETVFPILDAEGERYDR